MGPHCIVSIFRAECPSCQMSRAHVVSLYSWVMPEQNAEMFVDQIFRAFDRDNNGHLDFHVGDILILHQHSTALI